MRNLNTTKRFNDTKQILLEEVIVQRGEMSTDNGIAHEFWRSAISSKIQHTFFEVV